MGDILASAILSFDMREPAILFFYGGVHTVLTTHFEYYIDACGRPVATSTRLHDPDRYIGGEHLEFLPNKIKEKFIPVQNEYIAVIESRSSFNDGIYWHTEFIKSGGTYYGGPRVYNPKGLSIDPKDPE